MINTDRPALVIGDTVTTDVVVDGLVSGGFQEVYTASDHASAWKQLEEHAVEIVFVERLTPGIDGLKLLQEIRGNREYEHLAVVLLTPKILSPADDWAARRAKVNGVLPGLFTGIDVLALIDHIFPDFGP